MTAEGTQSHGGRGQKTRVTGAQHGHSSPWPSSSQASERHSSCARPGLPWKSPATSGFHTSGDGDGDIIPASVPTYSRGPAPPRSPPGGRDSPRVTLNTGLPVLEDRPAQGSGGLAVLTSAGDRGRHRSDGLGRPQDVHSCVAWAVWGQQGVPFPSRSSGLAWLLSSAGLCQSSVFVSKTLFSRKRKNRDEN